MFERIKAYKSIKKSNKFLKGCKLTAELTGDITDMTLKGATEPELCKVCRNYLKGGGNYEES